MTIQEILLVAIAIGMVWNAWDIFKLKRNIKEIQNIQTGGDDDFKDY